ncbi:MAG: WbqC family protein [Bacteroidales bacterium]|nr:WbqC family protein [Bacteroidales bacterium]
MSEILLSTAYLPNIQYIRAISQNNNVIIEQFENFPKQSFRNRAQILTTAGVVNLSIPIIKGNSKHFLKDTKISYSEHWQSQHWHTIVSAYNSSPFFEYFRDDFEPFFTNKYEFLLDYNLEITNLICKILHIKSNISLSEDYIKENDNNYFDLRNIIHPKKQQIENENYYKTIIYPQVFDQKFKFVPNLSIIDMIFNIGFEAEEIIKK